MSIKILATADLHIGISSSAAENQTTASTRNTWDRMVDWAMENNVDAVVISGDIVDRENKFVEGMSTLKHGLDKLQAKNIHTIMAAGNHDFQTLPDIMRNFDTDLVHFLGAKGTWEVKKVAIRGTEIQFVGWSFPRKHFTKNPLENFPEEQIETDKPTIGLLHGDYSTNLAESVYAPIDLNSLSNKNIDIWVLGHIHKPEILNENKPTVFYPGSPQALSAKEQGEHGFRIIEIDNNMPRLGEFIPISSVRYENIKIELTNCEDLNEVNTAILNNLLTQAESIETYNALEEIIFDVELTGEYHNINELRILKPEDFTGHYGLKTKVRKFVFNTRAKVQDLFRLSEEPTAIGMLAKAILDLRAGNKNHLLDSARNKITQKMADYEKDNVFIHIRADIAPKKYEINQLLEEELNRLLAELYNQKVEA